MCVSCLAICRTEGDRETYWAGSWASDLAEIEGISCSGCRLHSQPLLLSPLSFTFVLDPQPLQILSHSSSHHLQSLYLPHHHYILHPLLPPIIICLSAFLTLQLSCCFSVLYSLDFTCFLHLSSPFHPFFFSFLSQLVHTPREKHGPDEHGEAGTNQSIDLSTYPLLCPSDRQQKTKCLLSETFPISFPTPSPSHPSPLHCPPYLLMESPFLGPVHPAGTCLPITFL